MKAPGGLPVVADLRQTVAEELSSNPTLIAERGVTLQLAAEEHAPSVADLYKRAFERGDYFASRYEDPDDQIFNPDWLIHEFQDPKHLRFVFMDGERRLLGATAFFHDNDSESGPLMTSDATQIDPTGRGLRIMDRFFKRVVPIIEASGAGLATDFVLTPESKGLRRTLQTDLGMIALGIHPHVLSHRQADITRTEISAAKYPALTPKQVEIAPDFESVYRIVQSQLPTLSEPNVVRVDSVTKASPLFEGDSEIVEEVDAADPRAQVEALRSGWAPVEYDPDNNIFKVAKFPSGRPNLDFILTNEQVPANKLLVRYLYQVLFGIGQPVQEGVQP
jgi:hypothetical protein